MDKITPWKFDTQVASTFSTHARQHIPNYDQVIDQCIEICKEAGEESKIIDVGCAVGETLVRLKLAGFNNLHGVDNSQSMLDQCPKIANLQCSDYFPNEMFDIVLMNWTLHFIPDKISYLRQIYKNLNNRGVLVLTEKTVKDSYAINFYHNFKRFQGVSEEDIAKKAKSVENVMHINNALWYLNTLSEVGFKQTYIINSHWCFNTFVCIK